MSREQTFERAEQRLFSDYGTEIRPLYLELREPRLRARVVEAGAGAPVLLVHGGGANAASWAPLMAGLGGLRVLAVDRPGCGLTDGFDYRGVDLRHHAVAFLESLLDALGLEQVPVVGNSMGGLWGLWLALDRPERISSLLLLGCPALILVGGVPLGLRLLSVPVLNRLLMAMQRPGRGVFLKTMASLGERREVLDRLPSSMEDVVVATMRLPTYRQGWLSLVETAVGHREAWTLQEDALAQVRQPTLLVWGEDDPFSGLDVARRVRDAMPDCRLVDLPGAGHLPWFDEPERCAALVREHIRAAGPTRRADVAANSGVA